MSKRVKIEIGKRYRFRLETDDQIGYDQFERTCVMRYQGNFIKSDQVEYIKATVKDIELYTGYICMDVDDIEYE